jgi:biopolymer transport protein TolR
MAGPTSNDPERLTAAQRSRIRRLSAPRELAPDEEAGELNLIPFLDIITNVLMFVLASVTVSFTVTLDADAPKGGSKGVKANTQEESLSLTVLILEGGYFVKGRSASIAAGCQTTCSGNCPPTVPRVAAGPDESADGKKYDAASLTQCVRTLKTKLETDAPQLAAERQVMITANPNVPFQEVVRAMDALRKDDKGELYPDVVFTVLK